MKVPTHLQHMPIIGVPFYSKKDGKYAKRAKISDAKALSIGKAQYEDDEYSAKVFRYDSRWSPQSEELPFHRVLDLAILLVTTIAKESNIDYNSIDLKEEIVNNENLKGLFDYLTHIDQKIEIIPRLEELKKHIEEALKTYK